MFLPMLIGLAIAAQGQPASEAAVFDRGICGDAAKRDAFLKNWNPEAVPVLVEIKETGRRNEERMTAKLDRLAERAKWSAEKKSSFTMELMADPEFEKQFNDAIKILSTMMEKLSAIAAEKDEAKQCQTAADMFDMMPAVTENAELQWRAMSNAIDAEARRLGISLED